MSPHTSWVLVNEVMPRLHSAIPNVVRCVGSEDHKELIQDGAHMAAKMLVNAEKAKKKVTAGNIAYYTIQHLKSGRRSVGSSVVDALATGTQFTGNSSVGSMDEEVAQDTEFDVAMTWNDVISLDTDDPAQQAMRKLDWEIFMQQLDGRMQKMLEWIAEGRTLTAIANKLRVSQTRVVQLKEKLVSLMREYFGSDIWRVLAAQPQWKVNLMAMREYLACKYERNAASCV